jgi:hypothetical protein
MIWLICLFYDCLEREYIANNISLQSYLLILEIFILEFDYVSLKSYKVNKIIIKDIKYHSMKYHSM